jgi:hypothetical protein
LHFLVRIVNRKVHAVPLELKQSVFIREQHIHPTGVVVHDLVDDFCHLFRSGLFKPFAPMHGNTIIAHQFQEDADILISQTIVFIVVEQIV